jgi:hypothetical protein
MEDAEVSEDRDAVESFEEAAPKDLDDSRDHPVAEPDVEDPDHPMAESAPDVDDTPPQERLTAADVDDGLSTLQVVAILLAVLSAGLLLVGFVLPRWWSSTAD